MKFEWEEIWNNKYIAEDDWWEATYRVQVPGGWLIKHETGHDDTNNNNDYIIRKNEIIFISDPNHMWSVDAGF